MADNAAGLKSPKNRKILIVLVLAFILMMGAAFGTYYMLTPARATIFVFNSNYTAGTQVTRTMLTAVQVDTNLIIGGKSVPVRDYYVTGGNYNAVLQSAPILRTDVRAGTSLMSSMLTTTGGNSIEMKMKPNAVAVTIAASSITGVTEELAYGSHVNVYASYNTETVLLLQNMRILRSTWGSNGLASVTLELDIEQSLMLIHAQTYGSIYLGLVDATGYQYTTEDMPTYNLSGFTVPATVAQSGNQILETQQQTMEDSGASEGEETLDATDPENPAEIIIGQ